MPANTATQRLRLPAAASPMRALQGLEEEQVRRIADHGGHQHLAFDADVDHAGALAHHAAEGGEGDGRGQAQRLRQGVLDTLRCRTGRR